jgi:hypothetical protein
MGGLRIIRHSFLTLSLSLSLFILPHCRDSLERVQAGTGKGDAERRRREGIWRTEERGNMEGEGVR